MSADASMRRLGVLVCDTDTIVEFDFKRFMPDTVSFHVARLDMPKNAGLAADASLQMMCDSAPEAGRKVAAAEVEAILFACTAASFFRGRGSDMEVARSIMKATDLPATTTATAVSDALQALDARRIFLATPYSAEVNAREIEFLGYRNVETIGEYSFNCALSRDVAYVAPDAIRDRLLARREEIVAADALFISCTMLRATEVALELERALDVPVITSNLASMWTLLRRIRAAPGALSDFRLFAT